MSPLPSLSLLPPRLLNIKPNYLFSHKILAPAVSPPGIIILYLKSHFISPCILFQSQVAATVPTQQTKGTKYHILLKPGPPLSEHRNLGLFHFKQKLHIKIVWLTGAGRTRDLIWKQWPAVRFITARFFLH